MMTYVLLGLAIYVGLFALVNRICTCVEYCALAKSYGYFVKNGDDFKRTLTEFKGFASNVKTEQK